MNQLKLQDIYPLYREIKQKAQKESRKLYSNIYQFYNQKAEGIPCDYRIAYASLVFSYYDEKNVHRVYFASYDLCELSEELEHFPKGSVLDYVCKGENVLKQYICRGGFEEIATYTRKSINLLTEGKEFKRSHSEILDPYYDETVGEYATEEDAEEIVGILDEVFDKDTDHIPSVNEIREYIRNNWVLIYRHLDKIRCLYIFQIQGKRFYSNFSYNSMPAVVLYCLEKRAHMDVIRKYDVILKYSWISTSNAKSLQRNVLNFDDIYTYIYKKV